MYRNILVAVDGSMTSNSVMQEAAKLAGPDVIIRVITVVENPYWAASFEYGSFTDMEAIRKSLLKGAKEILEHAQQQMAARNVAVVTQLVDLTLERSPDISQAILQAADSHQCDLIVIGARGRRVFNRLLMGSVAEHLLRLADKPILLVRGLTKSDEMAKEDVGNGRKLFDFPDDEMIGT